MIKLPLFYYEKNNLDQNNNDIIQLLEEDDDDKYEDVDNEILRMTNGDVNISIIPINDIHNVDENENREACNLIIETEKENVVLSDKSSEGKVYFSPKSDNRDIIKINYSDELSGEKYINSKQIINDFNNFIKDNKIKNLLISDMKFCNDTQQIVIKQRHVAGKTIAKTLDKYAKNKKELNDYIPKLCNYIIEIVNTINILYKNNYFHNDMHYDNVMIENDIPIIIDYGYLRREPLNGNYHTYKKNIYYDNEILTTSFLDIGQLLNTIINKIDIIDKLNNNDIFLNLKKVFKKYFITTGRFSRADIGINYNSKDRFENENQEKEFYNNLVNDINNLNDNEVMKQKYMKYKIKYLKLKNANRIMN
jgi:hypothetical protein